MGIQKTSKTQGVYVTGSCCEDLFNLETFIHIIWNKLI